ncbi:MAG: hypothetical protein OXC15_03135 [Rhodospirillaceae bacterium]|nr:hypothetical protein [Rhodospirillaceae bacterium]
MKKMKLTRSLLAACSIVALTAVMYGCVHSGDDPVVMEDPPTAYEQAVAAIAAAGTAADAQAAYDAVKDDVTAAEGELLQAAVDARIMAINMMDREADQKMALMTAAGAIDTSDLSTQELVDAARTAIAMLRGALAAAADVSDGDKAMYQTRLDNAVMAVDTAQGGLDTATRRTNQMTALTSASGTLQTALAALSGSTPTQALLDAANTALTALNDAIAGGADLTDTEKAPYQREANNAAAPIQTAQTAFDNAEDEATKAEIAAMAVTAAKLYDGISAPMGDPASPANTDRAADYDTAGTAILVSIGDGTNTPTAQSLSEDKDATVDDHHGWTGQMFTASGTGVDGTYEAVVYSNVGEATEGDKFSAAYPDTEAYVTEGVVSVDTSGGDTPASRVASPSFDQSAGTKEFEKGMNELAVMISGSFHGVPGTYSCTPAAETTCAARIAAEGFQLGVTADATNAFTDGGGTWTFTPTNAETRLMDMPDNMYASYGWWLHKSADGEDFTASAFAANRGTVEPATGIDTLLGSATYMGGAAGKYALRSSTGGTNDAGHFTADAMLEADFGDDTITGTIDNFTGADGESRSWSVELKESMIGAAGPISSDGTDTGAGAETVWTIGETAAAAGGQWRGTLYDNDDGGVPQVATGTFHSTYGLDGQMVGAFGVDKQ